MTFQGLPGPNSTSLTLLDEGSYTLVDAFGMILGNELGIGHDPGQRAALVGTWINVLRDDPLEIFRAAARIRGRRTVDPDLTIPAAQVQRDEHHSCITSGGAAHKHTELASWEAHALPHLFSGFEMGNVVSRNLKRCTRLRIGPNPWLPVAQVDAAETVVLKAIVGDHNACSGLKNFFDHRTGIIVGERWNVRKAAGQRDRIGS
jgi:hypothetical protein